MSKPIIHLWSIAGSDRNIARQLGLRSTSQLVNLVQDAVGPDYRVTTNLKLFEAKVNERQGGRSDDAERARDIERALADDRISAIVSVRGARGWRGFCRTSTLTYSRSEKQSFTSSGSAS